MPSNKYTVEHLNTKLRQAEVTLSKGQTVVPPSPTLRAPFPWRIFPIPPAPALLDEFLIEMHAIGNGHISKDVRVLVVVERVSGDVIICGSTGTHFWDAEVVVKVKKHSSRSSESI